MSLLTTLASVLAATSGWNEAPTPFQIASLVTSAALTAWLAGRTTGARGIPPPLRGDALKREAARHGREPALLLAA